MIGTVSLVLGLCLTIACSIGEARPGGVIKDVGLVLALLILAPELPLFLSRLVEPDFLH